MKTIKKGIRKCIIYITKKPELHYPVFFATLLIVLVMAGCTFTGVKTNNGTEDAYFNVSDKDCAEAVKKYLEMEKKQDYTISLEIYEVAISESDTSKVIEKFKGSDYAKSKDWTDDYVENNIVAVAAYYTVQYDHSKNSGTDGDFIRIFYLEYDDENGLWTIWDNDGGIELDAFLNGSEEWPDCLTKLEDMEFELPTLEDGIIEEAESYPYKTDFYGYITDILESTVSVDKIIWDTGGDYENDYAIINEDTKVTKYVVADDCQFWILKDYWKPCLRLDYKTFSNFLVQNDYSGVWDFSLNADGEIIMIGMQYQP